MNTPYTIVTSGPSSPVSVGDLTVNDDGSFTFAPVRPLLLNGAVPDVTVFRRSADT